VQQFEYFLRFHNSSVCSKVKTKTTNIKIRLDFQSDQNLQADLQKVILNAWTTLNKYLVFTISISGIQ